METNSLFLALSENELKDCILNETRKEWELLCSEDCNDSFTADVCSNFFLGRVVLTQKKHHERELGLFKEYFR